ncbi:MAG: transposase [Acidobacteriota bacterium]
MIRKTIAESWGRSRGLRLASKLATARAWELKEAFGHFWKYKSVLWASGFLDAWCERAMRSRLAPQRRRPVAGAPGWSLCRRWRACCGPTRSY